MCYGKNMDVQGHRGSRGTHPENTLPAFAEAVDAGAGSIEMDLMVTADDVVVVHHDLCIREVPICQLTAAQIGHVPRLREILKALKSSTIRFNLEIKRDPAVDPTRLAQIIYEEVEGLDQVYFSSFDREVLAAMKKYTDQLAFIFDEVSDIPPGIKVLSIQDGLDWQQFKAKGYTVYIWTVNDPHRWGELIEQGVDGIITDYPRKLVEYLHKSSDSVSGRYN
jgi:glycerophosphoryl diester phosphodiesterase